MTNPKKHTLFSAAAQVNPQYYCLLAALSLEFSVMAFGTYGLYFMDNYTIVPCMAFVGTVMIRKIQPGDRWQLWLSLAAVVWFAIAQMMHFASDMHSRSAGLFFSIYLLAFPFASFAQDHEKQAGLKLAGCVYIAAALVLSGLTLLLMNDALPRFLLPHVYWNGARLQVMSHPNISACILMIALMFCLAFSTIAPKRWQKTLCVCIGAMLFVIMSFTNSRTSILITCVGIGLFVFFLIFQKRNWKRFAAGALAAVLVICLLFSFSSTLFDGHRDQMLADAIAAQEAASQESTPPTDPASAGSSQGASQPASSLPLQPFDNTFPTFVNPLTGEIDFLTDATQGNLSTDLKTLNGRTNIWKAAFRYIEENPSVLIWGIDYSSEALTSISFHPAHAHNSWIETLICLGLPGLLIALVFTGIALWSICRTLWRADANLWEKGIAILLICPLSASILEPYLFFSDRYYHFADFIFFLCLGYLCRQPKRKNA